MKKIIFRRIVLLFSLLCLLVFIPNIYVSAETESNFTIKVETDKKEYKANETVTYTIAVKNTTEKNYSDLLIKDVLPNGVNVISTDGKIDGQTISWTMEKLNKGEEAKFELKVKLASNSGGNVAIKPSKPNISLPMTGGSNSLIILAVAIIVVLCGVFIYKSKGKKSKSALLLALVFTVSLFANINTAFAESIKVKEEISHKVKVGNSELVTNITIEAVVDNSEEGSYENLLDPEKPKWGMDSDNDGLSDAEEELFGTDPLKSDTDGDGLLDKFEIEASLNPLKIDTDDNGVLDGDEDLDDDKLTNLQEQEYGTNPIFEDSDSDGLSDYEEVKTYKTNANNKDTDNDGLSDYDEVKLETNPNNSDSNGNGIKDGDELYSTEITTNESEKDDNIDVVVSGDIKGEYLDDIVITNMEGSHPFITNDIPGYIGAPFRIGLYDENGEAEISITFKVNKDVLQEGDTISLYEYDEEENTLSEVQQLNRSLTSDEITINTKLIKKYKDYVILVSGHWNEAWDKEILEPNTEFSEMDIVLTIDSSGSMSWNDENNLRIEGSINLINKLKGENRAAVVDFDSYAVIRQGLTTDKDELIAAVNKIDSSGGTNISRGLAKAITALDSTARSILTDELISEFYEEEVEAINSDETLEEGQETGTSLKNEADDMEVATRVNEENGVTRDKYIMLLTDGQSTVYSNDPSIVYAKENGIKIFTIGLGSDVNEATLKMIAEATGGKYLFATSADDLLALFDELINQTIDLYTDSDDDGIPDYFERNLRLINGKIIKLDPNNPDSDGDGLGDGYEICGVDNDRDAFFSQYNAEKKAFNFRSNPDSKDTDGDDIPDGNGRNLELGSTQNVIDTEPRVYNLSDRKYLESANFSYIDSRIVYFNNTKPVSEVSYTLKDGTSIGNSEIGDWTVVKHNSSKPAFGAIALKNGNNLIVAFAGTNGIMDAYADASMLWQKCSQSNNAANFIQDVLDKNKDIENIYVTGHSLGGVLAQYVISYLYDKGYNNLKAITFNSAPFTNPKHIAGKNDSALLKIDLNELIFNGLVYAGANITFDYFVKNFGKSYNINKILSDLKKKYSEEVVDKVIQYIIKYCIDNNGAINHESPQWDKYDKPNFNNIVRNYVIKGDPLNLLMGGRYIGSDVEYIYSKGEVSDLKPTTPLANILAAHDLARFYDTITGY